MVNKKDMKLNVQIGGIKMKNPIMLASGTYEYNNTTKGLLDINKLGAIVTKTVTLNPKEGNPPPRTCETYAGMLNAIGLENKGVGYFINRVVPELKRQKIPIIASISGKSSEEIERLTRRLDKVKGIAGIELNLSCPNVGETVLIAQDPKATHNAVIQARKETKKTIIAKLSPNVTDIREIARAAEQGGADAVSLVNTVSGMAIDIESRRSALGNITGGLSGPAIKPIALKMVFETAKAVKVPVIGIGGILESSDVIEFLMAGATAVEIGTGTFVNPRVAEEALSGLKKYLLNRRIRSINSLIGSIKT